MPPLALALGPSGLTVLVVTGAGNEAEAATGATGGGGGGGGGDVTAANGEGVMIEGDDL